MHFANHFVLALAGFGLTMARSIGRSPVVVARDQSLEDDVCKARHPSLTPLDSPVKSPLLTKRAARKPQDYLEPHEKPFGRAAAEWQRDFFGHLSAGELTFSETPQIAPKDPKTPTPTLITLFYPNPIAREGQGVDVYLRSIARLAKTQDQVIIFTEAGDTAEAIRAMRPGDPHWHVIDKYATVWDFPNVRDEKHNFATTQIRLFAEFDEHSRPDWRPKAVYNQAFLSAVQMAKAFCIYEAVMLNPFGSELWGFVDAGFLKEVGPKGPDGEQWSMLFGGYVDWQKIARAVSLAGDTGVVFAEYPNNVAKHDHRTIRHACFTERTKIWQCKFFIASSTWGSTLGMLRYATRFLQTFDDMNANGVYVGREEFILPTLAYRYPNTIFSIPEGQAPPLINDPLYGTAGQIQGKYVPMTFAKAFRDWLPRIDDPLATRYCRGTTYQPRKQSLRHGVWEIAV